VQRAPRAPWLVSRPAVNRRRLRPTVPIPRVGVPCIGTDVTNDVVRVAGHPSGTTPLDTTGAQPAPGCRRRLRRDRRLDAHLRRDGPARLLCRDRHEQKPVQERPSRGRVPQNHHRPDRERREPRPASRGVQAQAQSWGDGAPVWGSNVPDQPPEVRRSHRLRPISSRSRQVLDPTAASGVLSPATASGRVRGRSTGPRTRIFPRTGMNRGLSAGRPADRTNVSGRHSRSAVRWTLLVRPPWSVPRTVRTPPRRSAALPSTQAPVVHSVRTT
jgi:hypothetical protein